MTEKMLVIRETSPLGDIIEYERRQTFEEWFAEYKIYKDAWLEKRFWEWYIPRANRYKNCDSPEKYPWRPNNFWSELKHLMIEGVIKPTNEMSRAERAVSA